MLKIGDKCNKCTHKVVCKDFEEGQEVQKSVDSLECPDTFVIELQCINYDERTSVGFRDITPRQTDPALSKPFICDPVLPNQKVWQNFQTAFRETEDSSDEVENVENK